MNQIILAFNFINRSLPVDLNDLFQFGREIHNYGTRISVRGGLFIPNINTTNFGKYSVRYSVPIAWNKFSNTNKETFKNTNVLKRYLKDHYISQYKLL